MGGVEGGRGQRRELKAGGEARGIKGGARAPGASDERVCQVLDERRL